MKKNLLLIVFIFLSFTSFGQVKLGLNFSPGFSFNRLNYEVDPNQRNLNYEPSGVGFRFIAGPELSFYFGENYAFVTGAWYALKKSGFTFTDTLTNSTTEEIYNLQYIQLPATFKLFTNEIGTDMKLYFQLGGTADIKIAEKAKELNYKTKARFKPLDVSLLLGSGVELQMGENTYFLVGIRYTRGLIDVLKKPVSEYINLNNDLITLDFGIRF